MVSLPSSAPTRRVILSLLTGAAMLLPLGYQLYVVAMVLAGGELDALP